MTQAQKAWLEFRTRQDRKRIRLSWWASLGTALLVLLVLFILGLFHAVDLAPLQGIAVRLGSPDGELTPLSVTTQSDPALQAMVNSAYQAPVEESAEEVADSGVTPAKPQPVKKTPSETKKAENPAKDSAVPTVRKVKGAENGNTSETTFTDGSSLVGRSLYVPIYLYMPLPNKLDPDLSKKLAASPEARFLFQAVYNLSPGGWTLKTQPEMDSRPGLWSLLEKNGYDLARAEYKTAKKLAPVTLSFKLSTPRPGSGPLLLNLRQEASSGDAAVDEAVFYGFRQSSYANGAGHEVEGRFTYDFSRLN